MTFVAQPYDQFVDDLLTSLTGGIIREEHRFLGTNETYSLATPGAIESSIRLYGQYLESFMLFENGRDYNYDEENEAISWLEQGRLPDEYSFFYINYYVQEGRYRLSDRNTGSVTATTSEAFAREFAVFHKQMEVIYRSAFVDFANGISLDFIASLMGLSRRGSANAVGEILFKRSTPSPGDITIPAGTLVSTNQGQNFETFEKRTLRKGQLSIIAPIRAQVKGPPGQVAAGSIQNINRPVFGIEAAINEADTFFTAEKETDDGFRRRIKGALERAGKSTINSIKFGLIESIPEITEENIQIIERTDAPGMVEINLGLAAKAKAELVRRVEAAIFESRPAGVRVTHNLPTRTLSSDEQATEAEIRLEPGRSKPRAATLGADDLASMPEGVLKLQVDATVRLVEPNISASEKEQLEEQVQQQVREYIEQLPMGEDIIYNKLLGRIMNIEDIADANLFIAADSSGAPLLKENINSSGRKASIDADKIGVVLMDEPVYLRINVKVEPLQNGNESSDDGVEAFNNTTEQSQDRSQDIAEALERINGSIRDAVNRVLAVSTGILTKETIQTAIKAEIDQDVFFQLMAGDAVTLDAEYEETGRLLNNTEQLVLADNQVPRLQNLNVDLREPLDG